MKTLPVSYKTLKAIAALEKLGCEIDFERQEEDIPPSDLLEEEEAERVCNKYNNWDEWAWFCAKVTVKYKGYEGTDFLGGCSYKSERDFKENSGYYLDMVLACIKEINSDIEYHNKEILKKWEIRKAKRLAAKYNLLVVSAI